MLEDRLIGREINDRLNVGYIEQQFLDFCGISHVEPMGGRDKREPRSFRTDLEGTQKEKHVK